MTPPHRHDDKQHEDHSRERAQDVELGPETRVTIIVAIAVCSAMLAAQAWIINLTHQFKRDQEEIRREMVTIDDAVAIHKVAVQSIPEPVRTAVAGVNIRDIIAENRRLNRE